MNRSDKQQVRTIEWILFGSLLSRKDAKEVCKKLHELEWVEANCSRTMARLITAIAIEKDELKTIDEIIESFGRLVKHKRKRQDEILVMFLEMCREREKVGLATSIDYASRLGEPSEVLTKRLATALESTEWEKK